MSAEADRTFLASDAYRAWKRRVQAASESIVVFGPYFDSLLDRLLKNSALAVEAITVVTDLSPASGALDYRVQLIAVRALIRRGIEVRSLSRLHAKVLLCDWRTATMGSQNFTSYGRDSHETTAVPADDLSESKLVATLKEWLDAAVAVDLSLVERLLADLGRDLKAVQDARVTLATSYEQLSRGVVAEQAVPNDLTTNQAAHGRRARSRPGCNSTRTRCAAAVHRFRGSYHRARSTRPARGPSSRRSPSICS